MSIKSLRSYFMSTSEPQPVAHQRSRREVGGGVTRLARKYVFRSPCHFHHSIQLFTEHASLATTVDDTTTIPTGLNGSPRGEPIKYVTRQCAVPFACRLAHTSTYPLVIKCPSPAYSVHKWAGMIWLSFLRRLRPASDRFGRARISEEQGREEHSHFLSKYNSPLMS